MDWVANAYAQGMQGGGGAGQGSFLVLLPMYALIFGVFYLFLIRPQQKKQQEHQQMVQALKKHDEIITSGGIHAMVMNVKDTTVVVKIDDNVKIEIDKSAVATVKKSKPDAA